MTFQSTFGEPLGGSGNDPESIKAELHLSDTLFYGAVFNGDVGVLLLGSGPVYELTVGSQKIALSNYPSPIYGFHFRGPPVTVEGELDSPYQLFHALQ